MRGYKDLEIHLNEVLPEFEFEFSEPSTSWYVILPHLIKKRERDEQEDKIFTPKNVKKTIQTFLLNGNPPGTNFRDKKNLLQQGETLTIDSVNKYLQKTIEEEGINWMYGLEELFNVKIWELIQERSVVSLVSASINVDMKQLRKFKKNNGVFDSDLLHDAVFYYKEGSNWHSVTIIEKPNTSPQPTWFEPADIQKIIETFLIPKISPPINSGNVSEIFHAIDWLRSFQNNVIQNTRDVTDKVTESASRFIVDNKIKKYQIESKTLNFILPDQYVLDVTDESSGNSENDDDKKFIKESDDEENDGSSNKSNDESDDEEDDDSQIESKYEPQSTTIAKRPNYYDDWMKPRGFKKEEAQIFRSVMNSLDKGKKPSNEVQQIPMYVKINKMWELIRKQHEKDNFEFFELDDDRIDELLYLQGNQVDEEENLTKQSQIDRDAILAYHQYFNENVKTYRKMPEVITYDEIDGCLRNIAILFKICIYREKKIRKAEMDTCNVDQEKKIELMQYVDQMNCFRMCMGWSRMPFFDLRDYIVTADDLSVLEAELKFFQTFNGSIGENMAILDNMGVNSFSTDNFHDNDFKEIVKKMRMREKLQHRDIKKLKEDMNLSYQEINEKYLQTNSPPISPKLLPFIIKCSKIRLRIANNAPDPASLRQKLITQEIELLIEALDGKIDKKITDLIDDFLTYDSAKDSDEISHPRELEEILNKHVEFYYSIFKTTKKNNKEIRNEK